MVRQYIFEKFYILSLLVSILSYAIFAGLKNYDSWVLNPSWLLTIESFAAFFAWFFLIRRWFCRIGGVLQWYLVDRGKAPFWEGFTGLVLVCTEINQLFAVTEISLHRIIFLLYGIMSVWLRYDTVPYLINRLRGIYDCYPPEKKILIPPDAGVETVAVVTDCGTIGDVVDSDMIMHYWVYGYEYRVPGKDETKKYFDVITFTASGWRNWFEKYHEGFRFPIRYDKNSPKQHIRLDNFD